jgi:HK97 family phage portal protein
VAKNFGTFKILNHFFTLLPYFYKKSKGMNYIDRIKAALGFNQKDSTYLNAVFPYLGNNVIWTAPTTQNFIEKGLYLNSDLYAIINLIINKVSTAPIIVYEVKDQKALKYYKSMSKSFDNSGAKFQAQQYKARALEEVSIPELDRLFKKPNEFQTWDNLLKEIAAFRLITGNAYIYGARRGEQPNAPIIALYSLPAQYMEIISGGLNQPIKEYRLTYNGYERINANNVGHLKNINLSYTAGTANHLYGASPLRSAVRDLTTSNDGKQALLSMLQNMGARGILTGDGTVNITREQAQGLKEDYKSNYQGANRAGDVIITPAKLSWVQMGMNAVDMSIIDTQKVILRSLCRVYGVDAKLLGDTEASTFNNTETAYKALINNVVRPLHIEIRDVLNNWLLESYGNKNLFLDFDYMAYPEMQDDMDKLVNQLSAAWWLTPNEKRAAMNYGEYQNTLMEQPFIPQGLMTLAEFQASEVDNIDNMGDYAPAN